MNCIYDDVGLSHPKRSELSITKTDESQGNEHNTLLLCLDTHAPNKQTISRNKAFTRSTLSEMLRVLSEATLCNAIDVHKS